MNFNKMNISAFAKLCGVTPRAIKHYESMGLLRPAFTEENGYRVYTLSQVDRISSILLLRDHGFSLAEIKELLSRGELSELKDQLELQLDIIRRKKAELDARSRNIKVTYSHIKNAMKYGDSVFCEEISPCRIKLISPHEMSNTFEGAALISYATNGFQSGAVFEPEKFRFQGQYIIVKEGGELLTGRRICLYSRNEPSHAHGDMHRLLDEFRTRSGRKPGNIYTDAVIDELSENRGLMLYYIMLPE